MQIILVGHVARFVRCSMFSLNATLLQRPSPPGAVALSEYASCEVLPCPGQQCSGNFLFETSLVVLGQPRQPGLATVLGIRQL